MSKRKIIASLSFAGMTLGTALALTGCGGHPRNVVYVSTPPPPRVTESVIVSPGSGYVWIGGYHTWNGSRYEWVPGHWERHGGRWAPGHWKHDRNGWYWVEGHWR